MADAESRSGGPEWDLSTVTRGQVPGEAAVKGDGEVAGAVSGGGHAAGGMWWQVTTECSEYTLDPVGGRVRRTALAGVVLRGDGEWVPLRSVVDLRVGRPMVLVLLLREDGILTIRYTSPVLRGRRLTSPPETP